MRRPTGGEERWSVDRPWKSDVLTRARCPSRVCRRPAKPSLVYPLLVDKTHYSLDVHLSTTSCRASSSSPRSIITHRLIIIIVDQTPVTALTCSSCTQILRVDTRHHQISLFPSTLSLIFSNPPSPSPLSFFFLVSPAPCLCL